MDPSPAAHRPRPACTAAVLGLLAAALGLLLARPIDLITADLGRHLANGRWINDDTALLHSNFYAHDFAAAPFVNHHWFSGVVFHAVATYTGFVGLSLFYIALVVAAFLFVLHEVYRQAGARATVCLGTLAVPLIAFRTEVRPEGFSGLFAACFLVILLRYQRHVWGKATLYFLPLLMVLWVNLHIYFVFGFVLVAACLGEELLRASLKRDLAAAAQARARARDLALTLVLCAAAALVNPFGWRLALYPLHIFDNYGYLIVENQSVWFLHRLHMMFPVFVPLYTTIALIVVGLIRQVPRLLSLPLASIAVALLVAAMAVLGIRNISFFGLVALPALAALWPAPAPTRSPARLWTYGLYAMVSTTTAAFLYLVWPAPLARFGLGLPSEQLAAAQFFKAQGIQGPIFNNYDIGGYLIFTLFPGVRPFVDNRPEAYPEDFFTNTYVPMQEQPERWREAAERYGFNAIVFYWHDLTPAAQTFLLARVRDDLWVPVYVDDFAIIFVKRTEANAALIGRYGVPRERFGVK